MTESIQDTQWMTESIQDTEWMTKSIWYTRYVKGPAQDTHRVIPEHTVKDMVTKAYIADERVMTSTHNA